MKGKKLKDAEGQKGWKKSRSDKNRTNIYGRDSKKIVGLVGKNGKREKWVHGLGGDEQAVVHPRTGACRFCARGVGLAEG